MFSFFGAKNHFGVPAGAILPTTRFPPAFTPSERATVEAFFGRKHGKRRAAHQAEGDRETTARPRR
jgi:hypothetical protein